MTAHNWHDLYIYIGGFSLLLSIILWTVFGFVTMRKLDKAIVAEGKRRPCQWDPMWCRAILYTWPIVFSGDSFSELENRIIDTQDVKKNINALDKFLGWSFFLSIWTMTLCAIIGWLFGLF